MKSEISISRFQQTVTKMSMIVSLSWKQGIYRDFFVIIKTVYLMNYLTNLPPIAEIVDGNEFYFKFLIVNLLNIYVIYNNIILDQ